MSSIDYPVARAMRDNGASYTTIGERFGVSRQYAYQYLRRREDGTYRKCNSVEKIPYKGLYEYVKATGMDGVRAIAMYAYGDTKNETIFKLNRYLHGDADPSWKFVLAALKATGMDFEDVFKERSDYEI